MHCTGRAFASFKLDESAAPSSFAWTNTQVRWRSPASYVHSVDANSACVRAEDASALLEGVDGEWAAMGAVPTPCVLFAINYTRLERLLIEWEERIKRSYKRCNTLILKATATPFLCENCVAHDGASTCVVCQMDVSAAGGGAHGSYCKACTAASRFKCARCGESCGKSRELAVVCATCLRSGRECVRMLKA